MAFCRNCGAQIQPGEKFCTSCGSKIEEADLSAAEAVTGAAAGAAAASFGAPAQEPIPEPVPEPVQEPVYQPAQEPVYQSAPDPSYQQTAPQTFDAHQPGEAAETDPDIAGNKVMAVLAYFGVLVLIPLFVRKDSKFARFHVNQGLVLMFAATASNIIKKVCAAYLPGPVSSIINVACVIVSLAVIVLSIMGIINAAKGTYKSLPVIGNIKLI